MKKWWALILLAVVLALRFINLGTVPSGISLSEARFGIFLSELFGAYPISLTVIRAPFAILGSISVFIFYLLVLKFMKNFKLALLSAFILAVSPWHIQESRIFSWGILITTLITIILLVFWLNFLAGHRKISTAFLMIAFIVFTVSLSRVPDNAGNEVNYQRNIAAQKISPVTSRIFSNKLVASSRYKVGLFFENLDFGNYFFSGYPRQRWGVEEIQKLYVIFLPFLVYGIYKSKGKYLITFSVLFLSYVFLLASASLQKPSFGLPLILILAPLISKGFLDFIKTDKSKILILLTLLVLFFESFYFWQTYNLGLTESDFSPRNKYYYPLTHQLSLRIQKDEEIVISKRLLEPETFFSYYRKALSKKIRVSEIDYKKDMLPGKVFVDVLPFEPSPSEPLFKKEGNWPEYLDVLFTVSDAKTRQEVVVFRSKL